MSDKTDLKKLLQRVIELVMPDLRHYYRLPRKGQVVKSYASDGQYWADVQPLRNDESVDKNEPVISRVEIPILWGGPNRGVVCPPAAGTLCDITYYDGDPNYPRISNFRWLKNKAPVAAIGELIIQYSPSIFHRISSTGSWINGPLHVTGAITCDSTIADHVRTMDGDRDIYNDHTNPLDGAPPQKM